MIPAGTTFIDPQSVTDLEVEKIIVPESVEQIQDNAFKGRKRLKEITFVDESRLRDIGINAFAGTGIEVFIAPSSLRTVA